MAPKIKITKKDIIDTTVELVRQGGEEAINARSIAAALNCSTQPIFFNFTSMEELYEEVVKSVYDIYTGFLSREVESGKYPAYKAFGMAYVRFASEETQLFNLLFMRERKGEGLTLTGDFSSSVEMIMKNVGLSREKAELMHIEIWAFVHGIATMIATSFFTPKWEDVSDMLSDVYQGLKARHSAEDK